MKPWIPRWYWITSPTEYGHHMRVYWRLGFDETDNVALWSKNDP